MKAEEITVTVKINGISYSPQHTWTPVAVALANFSLEGQIKEASDALIKKMKQEGVADV